MAIHDDFVWRIYTEAPFQVYEVVLPKDLEWIDEFSWSSISQEVKNSLTGSIFINEYKMLEGREITLEGKDDMGWVQRPVAETLLEMRNTLGLKMTLEYTKGTFNGQSWSFGEIYKSFNVLFRQGDTPLDFENVKRFDNFDPESWFKIKNIKFMEIGDTDPINPCG